jgi:alpha-glucuronidase
MFVYSFLKPAGSRISGRLKLFFSMVALLNATFLFAENGHELWLRYRALPDSQVVTVQQTLQHVVITRQTPKFEVIRHELSIALPGMINLHSSIDQRITDNSLVITTADDALVRQLKIRQELQNINNEGYIIKTLLWKKKHLTVIVGKTDAGALYGTFTFLRQLQTGKPIDNLNITEQPRLQIRILNHWDNLDGSVERGYAGHSIWWNVNLSADSMIQRHADYGRACASVGINATVLNNVNASPQTLSAENLQKTATIANRLRPYNIRVYLAINFSSPAQLGGLPTADPLDPAVQQWWKTKVQEIYNLIPDFGGFLVKANSEGLPGPQDFGRTHADGANMLADALKPFGGLVMWRAFVYNPLLQDRAKQAYNEFKPLDGQFRDNVIVQVKNGPIDFQPREPFSPLFGAMNHTALMPELQITQEYMGASNHLVFLAPMYAEFLNSDTWCRGEGSLVAKTIDGTLFQQSHTAMAAVANIGLDANWCGHHFAQANWYAFGRLSWDYTLSPGVIANEWVMQTFSKAPNVIKPITTMMLQSHEACVDYMTPLGLHHLMAWDHHYGPEPWCAIEGARADWMPSYYHKADSIGLGFDRTKSGSDAVSQYFEPLRSQLSNIDHCPEKYLLWFHHVKWSDKLQSGNTLWDELCEHYYRGAAKVADFQIVWQSSKNGIDTGRFDAIQDKLKIQYHDAIWWRNACLLYFQTFSKMPIPQAYEQPAVSLEDLKKIHLNLSHHN